MTYQRSCAELFAHVPSISTEQIDPTLMRTGVLGVTANSSRCAPGFIFVAVRGATKTSRDGHDFIAHAKRLGAIAAIVDKSYSPKEPIDIPLIYVDDSKLALCLLVEAWHDFPSHKLKVIGITGTNGKTSTTFMLHSILKAAHFRPKIMGTLGAGDPHALTPLTHTTMDPEYISAYLAQMVLENVSHVVMEVSSHALSLKRVEALHFTAVALTNITQDHLDLHQTLDNYREAKARLFFDLADDACIKILPDDHPFGQRAQRLTMLTLHSSNAVSPYALPFYGDFHHKNAMTAASIARALGIDETAIASGLLACPPIPGRLEAIPHQHDFKVFVDFAHTPHALNDLLVTLRKIPHQKLIVVFGCGGDREKEKRPLMGRIASEHADMVIITDDNPRTEDASHIRAHILAGVRTKENVHEIAQRSSAIAFALRNAKKNDLVVIAGKGHENYQIYGTTSTAFSDGDEARKVLQTL